jgi:hypothetical protein
MDALLSIPALGYFLMPSLGTYSTSLNLLFFYMTWSTLVLSQSPLRVEILGSLGIRAVFFLVPSLLFLIFDSVLPSLAVGIKTQGRAALPTRTGGVRVSRRISTPQWYRVVGLSVVNVCLGAAIQAGVEALFTNILHVRSALKVTTTLPMPWSIAKDVLKCLLMREVRLIAPLTVSLLTVHARSSSTTLIASSSTQRLQILSATFINLITTR